jgi:coproporphyrinogen III oxidase-like Fe-S oxidoreductase
VLLEIRLREGLPLDLVEADRADLVVRRGLAEVEGDRLVLTRRGRLLGDAVVRELVN